MVAVEEVQHLDSDSASSLIYFHVSFDNEKIVPFRPNQPLNCDDAVHIEEEATAFKERDGTNVVGQMMSASLNISPPRLEPGEQGRVV